MRVEVFLLFYFDYIFHNINLDHFQGRNRNVEDVFSPKEDGVPFHHEEFVDVDVELMKETQLETTGLRDRVEKKLVLVVVEE